MVCPGIARSIWIDPTYSQYEWWGTFKAPFWRYLGLLILTYVWLIALLTVALLVPMLIGGTILHGGRQPVLYAGLAGGAVGGLFALWGIIRQVPFFTALTQDPPHPGWRDSVRAMRGQVWRYALVFFVAMLPLELANAGLDELLKLAGADRHAVPVALGESAFRQAMLFAHFSLGASIGALVFLNRFGAIPGEIATER